MREAHQHGQGAALGADVGARQGQRPRAGTGQVSHEGMVWNANTNQLQGRKGGFDTQKSVFILRCLKLSLLKAETLENDRSTPAEPAITQDLSQALTLVYATSRSVTGSRTTQGPLLGTGNDKYTAAAAQNQSPALQDQSCSHDLPM